MNTSLSAPPLQRLESTTLSDDLLAEWLGSKLGSQTAVAYVHCAHRVRFFDVDVSDMPFLADPGKASLKVLKAIAKLGLLFRLELSTEYFEAATGITPSWPLLSASQPDVSNWYKAREKLFGRGRGKAISPQTAAQVWHAAAGICMYRGCGQDLGHTPLTTKAAQIAYLAHIVGSDPDGPRGGDNSHALSDNHENIMLLCDGHHRLIDRIDCAGHPIERLNMMREEHTQQVRSLLNCLAYPRAQIITLLADLAQVSTNTLQSDLYESLLDRRLSPLPNVFHAIRRTQRDDRARPNFWAQLLHEHEADIRNFILKASNRPASGHDLPEEVLAIFPIHLVPILVLAGRIAGEARPTEVFQYNRDRRSWQWGDKANSPAGSISISPLPSKKFDEVLLTIELTASVDEEALPPQLKAAIRDGNVFWLRLTHASPNINSVNAPEDLDEFTKYARQVVYLVQDRIRAKHVHLIGIAAASTLFRFGQLLQAGHHPTYEIYDRPDGTRPFLPAITITGPQTASTSANGQTIFTIPLK